VRKNGNKANDSPKKYLLTGPPVIEINCSGFTSSVLTIPGKAKG
jgi:hypothetical protein